MRARALHVVHAGWIALAVLAACGVHGAGAGDTPGEDAGGMSNVGSNPPSTSAEGGAASEDAGPGMAQDGASPANAIDAAPDAGPPPPPSAYLTTDDLAQALAPVTLTFGVAATADATVTIDTTTTYQSILGFGASITDSSSYVMTKYLTQDALQAALVQLFDATQGIGLSFLRQPMGASDFSSAGNFSYDDAANDTSLGGFAITQDLKATVPVLKQVLAISPTLFILGTPWSPPAWMKQNDSMNGTGGGSGSAGLDGNAYAPFGQYFPKFVQAYAAQGITVAAVTPQNEPLNGSAAYPGMDFDAPSETSFIGQDLGPAFKSAGLATQIWAYDHNWDVESYPETVMNDATAVGFTEGAAFHCYGGDPSAMTTFHTSFPKKSVYMTECSGGDWQTDAFASTIDLAIDSTSNWARAVSLWNMALDENKGPQNDGCSTCRGVVTVNSGSGAVTYNADFYALGHFSKFVRPGALRVASTSSASALHAVTFQNTDGRMAMVAHNTGSTSMAVRVGTGASAMNVTVPANAAVTVAWTPASAQ